MSGPWTRPSSSARRHRRLFLSPHLERLEDRTLLSVSAPAEFSTLTHDDPETPDDPFFDELWGMEKIEAEQAWDVTTGSSTIVVAGIDTGIDYTHPDLYRNIWINQDEIPQSRRDNLVDVDGDGLITFWDLNDADNQGLGKIDDLNANGYIDGGDLLVPMVGDPLTGTDTGTGGWADLIDGGSNGFVDDLIGWNFVTNTNDPMDRNFHGTHTAGTIGAVGNNGEGVVGVNWKVQIMPLKFITEVGVGFTFQAVPAINYAAQNGAHVSNNSWGGCCGENNDSDPLYKAVKEAGELGHLFVAAAGNSSANNDNPHEASYPASYDLPNIISVAATDRDDDLAGFSNYGANSVHLGAPGVDILSTFTTFGTSVDLYAFASGTSMAAPHVAGAAALVWSIDPDLTHLEVKDRILRNVDTADSLRGMTITGGRLNVAAAVQDAAGGQSGNDGGGPGNRGGRGDGGGRPENPGEGRGRGIGRGAAPGRGAANGRFTPHAIESIPRVEPVESVAGHTTQVLVGLSDAGPARPADGDLAASPADKRQPPMSISTAGRSSSPLFATTGEPDRDLEGDAPLSEDPLDTYFSLFGKGPVELSSGLPDFEFRDLINAV